MNPGGTIDAVCEQIRADQRKAEKPRGSVRRTSGCGTRCSGSRARPARNAPNRIARQALETGGDVMPSRSTSEPRPDYRILPYGGADGGWNWTVEWNGVVLDRGWARTWGEAQEEALASREAHR